MKAVKKTGLVPVMYRNKVIGVPPSDAIKGVKSGEMSLVTIRSDIETIDVLGAEKDVSVKDDIAPKVFDGVVIPDDWRTVHGTKRALIAKEILGIDPKEKLPAPEGVEIGDFAVSVIEAELEKRAAQESEPASAETDPAENPPVTNLETPAETPSA